MKNLAILLLLGLISYSYAGETLLFSDEFDKFDFKTWEHEQTLSGGGNWEYEWYVNNRSNSYVRDGILYLLPTMTDDAIGQQTMMTGDVNIWGGSPADMCT
jgi:hypothetical protein